MARGAFELELASRLISTTRHRISTISLRTIVFNTMATKGRFFPIARREKAQPQHRARNVPAKMPKEAESAANPIHERQTLIFVRAHHLGNFCQELPNALCAQDVPADEGVPAKCRTNGRPNTMFLLNLYDFMQPGKPCLPALPTVPALPALPVLPALPALPAMPPACLLPAALP